MRPRLLLVCVLVGTFLVTGSRLCGQALTGDILGSVHDSTGALVPDAKVTLTEVNTGVSISQPTDSSGNFIFTQLLPGRYRLDVSKTGFKTQSVYDITLLAAQRPRVDVTLQLGAMSQSVTVSASGIQLLDTGTSDVGQIMQDKPVVDLPLNGRNYIQLASLGPLMGPLNLEKSTFSSESTTYTGRQQGEVTISSGGLREENTSYLIDGIETRDPRWGTAMLRPSPDAIQEFKIENSGYGADNGESAVGVNLTLKSGANAFHGTVYDFLRNSRLDANDFFLNKIGEGEAKFVQNDFGGSLGGPIKRDNTFFFGSLEFFRSVSDTGAGFATVPSAAQLNGNLADDSAGMGVYPTNSPLCLANPTSPKCVNVINPSTGAAFPGNVIPTTMLNPISQKWIPYFQKPNVAVTPGLPTYPDYNFAEELKQPINWYQWNVRIDHNFGASDRLYGSYSLDDKGYESPSVTILGGTSYPYRGQLLALDETHIFTPRVVNELRYGHFKDHSAIFAETAYGTNITTDVFGIKNVDNVPFGYGVPDAGITGFSGVGSFNIAGEDRTTNDQVTDNLSIVRGKQQIKVGGNFVHQQFYYVCECSYPPGFCFSGQFSGSGLADMLLGIPDSARVAEGTGSLNTREHFYAGYVADDIRVRPNLTLNLGLRYEYSQWPQEINGREESYDPQAKQEVAVWRGQVRNGIIDPDWNNFAPRLGIAYSPFKNTVVRAAGGIFYSTDLYDEFGFVASGPDLFVDFVQESDPVTPTLSMSNLFPAFTFGAPGPGLGLLSEDKRNRIPYIEEWNFDIQHTFGHNWLLDLGYAGNRGNKIPQRTDQNTPALDPTGTIPVQDRRPNPNYNFILTSMGRGWSSYNGGFIKVEKQVSSSSTFLASYTYSHALDLGQDGSGCGGTVASRDYNVYDKGNACYDDRHRFIASYVYQLPFGQGRRWLGGASGIGAKLVSGWSLSGITTIESGEYTTPSSGRNWANLGSFTGNPPNKIGNPYPADQNYLDWWTASAFALPGCPSLTPCVTTTGHILGNTQNNSLQMPGMDNWDLGLLKDTKLTERFALQFRAEAFNAWNHTEFGSPGTNLSRPSFGVISSTRIPAREVQLALKLLW